MLLQSNDCEPTTQTAPAGQSAPSGAAFAVDLSEMTPFLLARALSLTGRRELAEDLVQETMANAWQARQSFTPGTNLKAWLCKILRNEFYSHQRRAWRQAPWCTVFEETIPSPPGEQMSAIDLCEAACAMNGLPDPQREALILVGVCGFSYEETALLLGGTLGTVKSRVARARLSLLNIMQSRRLRRTKLHPATCTAFNEWLIHLDQLRIAACRILESRGSKEHQKLMRVPKIPLRPNGAAIAQPLRGAEKVRLEDDAYAAMGSPAPVAPVLVRSRLTGLRGLASSLASPELVAAS
ncbi:MAG TPA: sigma-70 family RNA polymerase sigma factor [Stellaceae bacterium]|jgi:RNA polymerase sigma-70 factor (ECF subfamily)|nr:sigma-70 family RNA polymerase sigma factor [Stellaceae bacterium]